MTSPAASALAAATPTAADGATAENSTHLLRALVETAEVRQALSATLPEVLRAWAGESRLRALAANALARILSRGFTASRNGRDQTSLQTLLREPQRAREVAAQLPKLINDLLNASTAVSEGVALLSAEEKAGVLGEIVEKLDPALAGKMLTSVTRFLNEAQAADPVGMAERLRPGFRAWVGNVDFGELKTTVDSMAENTAAFAGMLNEEMWQYPTKMVCLLSMLPVVVNATIQALTASLGPINRLAPDLVADVLLSLLRDVKAEEVGRLVNAACEVFRRVHTGSVLIGENGKPQMPADLSTLAGDALRSVDIELLLKTRALLADTGESTQSALLALLEAQPALVREMIAARFRRRASGFRRLARATDVLERALTDDDIAAGVTNGLNEIDAQEVADTLNRLLAIANRVHDASPDALRVVLTQIISGLDEREAGETVRWVVADLVAALKPVAREVLPPVIKGLADLLASEAAGDGELHSAVDALRAALSPKEPTP
jgi:flagellar motility protein MotE (MotC chaperone)